MKSFYFCFFIIITITGLCSCKSEIQKVDNEYLKVDTHEGVANYEIKKETKIPLLVKNNALIKVPKLEDVSHQEFLGSSYLLLPKDHKFAHHFTNNPFQALEPIMPARASLWGHELVHEKTEHNTVLYTISKKLAPAELALVDEQKLAELFGDYKKHSLGKGGFGEVFKITYAGKNYALKSNASEVKSMEQLQFTDGVAKIYAMFNAMYKDKVKPFMIMELGQDSLDALNKRAEKLSPQQVIDAAKRFEKLIDAQEVLKIINADIKPANMILTQDGHLRLIDISEETTKGYSGSEGELMARALVENQRNLSLKGGHVALEKFYDYAPDYRSQNIASPVLMSTWSNAMCKKIFPTHAACSHVKDYDSLFALFTKPMLLEIGEQINEYWKDQTGTHDIKALSLYRTGLPLPNLQDISQDNWKSYFSKKDEIGEEFCGYLEWASVISYSVRIFFEPLKAKYSAFCQQQPDKTWVFQKSFNDFKDSDFREWIKDALSPGIKLETFRELARTGISLNRLYDKIIKREFDVINDPVGKAIYRLFNYKAAAE
jgi:hypothetical protein